MPKKNAWYKLYQHNIYIFETSPVYKLQQTTWPCPWPWKRSHRHETTCHVSHFISDFDTKLNLQYICSRLTIISSIHIVVGPNFDSALISIGELFLTADFLRWRGCWQYFHHRRSVLWFLHWEVYRPINASWCDVHTFDLLHTLFDAILASAFSSKCSRASK